MSKIVQLDQPGDYDLLDEKGSVLLKLRGLALDWGYSKSVYDANNNKIFRLWTREPYNRARAYAPHDDNKILWIIKNENASPRDRLVIEFQDYLTKETKNLYFYKTNIVCKYEIYLGSLMVANVYNAGWGRWGKQQIGIAGNVDYSLVAAMVVSLETFGMMADIHL